MTERFYRADAVQAVIALDALQLDRSLAAGGCPSSLRAYVADLAREDEDSIAYEGVAGPRPPVVLVEGAAFQADYELNSIPSAVATTECGRDMSTLTPSVVHVIERYASTRVKARVYGVWVRTAGEGLLDRADNEMLHDPEETLVLFDGYMTSVGRRAGESGYDVTMVFQSFLADLAYSSGVTGQIAASSAGALSFTPGLSQYFRTPEPVGGQAMLPMSPYGLAQIMLGKGYAVARDFWGFWLPTVTVPGPPRQGESTPRDVPVEMFGVKGFLDAITRQDLFAWQALQGYRAITGGLDCSPTETAGPPGNALAQGAVARIEPRNLVTGEGLRAAWGPMGDAVAQLGVFGTVVDRAWFTANHPQSYRNVGYVYGVPIPLSTAALVNQTSHPGRGFAQDIAGESVSQLGRDTIWDKLVGQYLPKYGMALAPMSTRAVVVPFCPASDREWQRVAASEYTSIEARFETPVDVRGAILLNEPSGWAGVMAGGQKASEAGGATSGFERFQAVFDTCRPGVFVVRHAPPWLINMTSPGDAGAAVTLRAATRSAASSPDTASKARADAVAAIDLSNDQILNAVGAVGGGLVAAAAVLNGHAPLVPPQSVYQIAYKLARAMYQQEKLRNRVVSIDGRFRLDIGPGSTVHVETPADVWANARLGLSAGSVTGVVTKVTIRVDAKGSSASTAFELGFVRMEGEMNDERSGLASAGHPYWGTVVHGVPLVDSLGFRASYGNRATIVR